MSSNHRQHVLDLQSLHVSGCLDVFRSAAAREKTTGGCKQMRLPVDEYQHVVKHRYERSYDTIDTP